MIDAAAEGAIAGLRLAGYIGAMLIAFVALIAMAERRARLRSAASSASRGSRFQGMLGLAFAPLALLMGVPAGGRDAGGLAARREDGAERVHRVSASSAVLVKDGAISPRSAVIASYALCGFANFGSLAILLGGLGGMAPSRRGEIASLGLRSILGGTLATLMAGCWAGIFL